ncbi:CACTA en-spm transposon protein [Cucumis melo var. makuwa]|uniref:CACTA en-spm transposon protein n=1 Tax=Cucumis melo var. makuwa TaxID=1194695 RepID=A0A5D3BT11_CUCMM|nr:CACTA en-spm transposon protein [Cucumis melo var. makuwa]TYK02284.1 CACTA en-spm transposon protein [Cucumis melo var. makuwa]
MSSRYMVTYPSEVPSSIRHAPHAWEIDRRSRYEGKYLSWDIGAISGIMFGVEVGYTMKSGIETRFTKDEQNDDIIPDYEEEKCLFHWYILNNVEEISEYRKHRVDEHIEDDTLCSGSWATTNDHDESRTISSFLSDFDETDALFLKFGDKFNNAGGSSLVGDNSAYETQPSLTPRRCQQSRLLELERYVHKNGKISITIAPGVEKPISSHTV